MTAGAIWRRSALIFAPLALLVALNLGLAYLPLGRFALWAGLGVAAMQALLTALFFMDLRTAKPLIRLAAVAGVIWTGIMFGLTFCEMMTRFR
jgi:caa(3)-type oxidase subunit IV